MQFTLSAKTKGAKGKDLYAQLQDLKQRQIITPDLHDWADGLRILGRDGAHPDYPEVSMKDALDGIRLLSEIIKFVYVLPHQRARMRQKKNEQ